MGCTHIAGHLPQAFRSKFHEYVRPREEAAGTTFSFFDANQIQELILPLLRCEDVRQAQLLGAELAERRCPNGISLDMRKGILGGLMQL